MEWMFDVNGAEEKMGICEKHQRRKSRVGAGEVLQHPTYDRYHDAYV